MKAPTTAGQAVRGPGEGGGDADSRGAGEEKAAEAGHEGFAFVHLHADAAARGDPAGAEGWWVGV
ncbi:hypothetical protein PC116_g31184 [Phytophthora cactorum]|nr:hypothetical protein PC116_g31184 [Phytophthora cactorum]